jgi:transposase
VLLPGNRWDTLGVAPLIEGIEMGALLGDKAYDSNWIIDELNQRGAKVVISQMPQRTKPVEIDLEMYKWRHLIENLLPPFGRCLRPCKLKEFKRIAMRACKTDQSFTALIQLCSAVINSR